MEKATWAENCHVDDLQSLMPSIWNILKQSPIICFKGGMGAGKTTFIAALCRYLGVGEAVSSPTFALVNEYTYTTNEGEGVIFHMDWYRLSGIEEAINAGIYDCLVTAINSLNTYCFIEWPEKAAMLLPPQYISVILAINEQGGRDISMTTPVVN